MEDIPNQDSAEFWSGPSGQSWIEHEVEQDGILRLVIDVLLDRAKLQAGDRVLDIGSGTGALSLACAERVGLDGRVLATDISSPLLRRAAKRSLQIPQVSTFLADAQAATWPEKDFDVAVSRFGVMFFADPPSAFINIARALRLGGRMIFAVWGPYLENPWWKIPQRAAVARLGQPPKVPPNSPGPMGLADMDYALSQLSAANLRDVSCEKRTVDLHHSGGVEAIAALATRIGPARRVMTHFDAGPDDERAIFEAIAGDFARFATDDGARVPATLNLLSALRG